MLLKNGSSGHRSESRPLFDGLHPLRVCKFRRQPAKLVRTAQAVMENSNGTGARHVLHMSRSNNERKPTSFFCPPTERDLVRCQVSGDGCDTTDAEVRALDVTLPVRIGGIDVKSTRRVHG